MSKDLEKNVLDEIKMKHIEPKPRWHFLLREYIIWLVALVALIIGALAVAVSIYMMRENDWDVYELAGHGILGFVFLTLPYFWIILLIGFVVLGYYYLRHTKGGYRYQLITLLLSSVAASFVFGFALYQTGLAKAIDQGMSKYLPVYEKILDHRQKIWQSQEKGLVAGVVIGMDNPSTIRVLGIDKRQWQVRVTAQTQGLPGKIVPGMRIRAMGQIAGDNILQAMRVIPYESEGACWKRVYMIKIPVRF